MPPHPRLRWFKPHSQSLSPALSGPMAARRELTALARQKALIYSVGVPFIEGAKTAKEYAVGLLKVAAEVEHALLVQYLYTADSINAAAEGQKDYRAAVRNVAVQEMGHLATVQNLLLLLEWSFGTAYAATMLRKVSEENPIPFVLEPVTLAALAKYTVAEMPEPDAVPQQSKQKMLELEALAAKDAGFAPHRVGAIYALLKWMFMDKEKALAWMTLAARRSRPGRSAPQRR